LEPRFVVGYRTFVDAQLSREHNSSTDISGKGTAPVTTAQGDPTGVCDLTVEAGHTARTDVKGDMKTPGQRIYAICYRKIKIEYREGKLTPSLDQTNKWKSLAVTRGEAAPEDEYVQANLLEEDDQESCGTHKIEAADGSTLVFGVLPDSSEDEDEDEDEEDDE
jgi:hypothetical protein